MKVVVSAFCLNEIKHVDRWWDSVKCADQVIVLDTGSTDGTVERLFALGATVYQEKFPDPFRFDTAGNRALELVPDDADVVLIVDLDEVVRPVNSMMSWSDAIKLAWKPGTTQGYYGYVWSWKAPGVPGVAFIANRLIKHGAYQWRRPCHPNLEYRGEGAAVVADFSKVFGILHFPDQSKSRASYLPLLRLGYEENPDDPSAQFYYARELTFVGEGLESTRVFLEYLANPAATWAPERMAAMRYIAQTCFRQGRIVNAEEWLRRAADEAPEYREPLVDLSAVLAGTGNALGALAFLDDAMKLKRRPVSQYAEVYAWDDERLAKARAKLVARLSYDKPPPTELFSMKGT